MASEPVSSAEVLELVRSRMIKAFLDFFLISEIGQAGAMSGYEAGNLIREKHNLMLSSGTIYSTLYAMEREGLLVGTWTGQKRVYQLSAKGKQNCILSIRIEQGLLDFMTAISKDIDSN